MPSSEERRCPHTAGWLEDGGVSQCRACGVLRFADYGAVRPPRAAAALSARSRPATPATPAPDTPAPP
ncbi:DUF6255 family natural product biosynthesis protein [Streptomyces olivoverticillatus]|uniref:DUF6255 family natural product biosynthesis protein n=1 Tax=Streptomyces olivoverticillatus TaxID=66427 RepID=UPI001C88D5E5